MLRWRHDITLLERASIRPVLTPRLCEVQPSTLKPPGDSFPALDLGGFPH